MDLDNPLTSQWHLKSGVSGESGVGGERQDKVLIELHVTRIGNLCFFAHSLYSSS